MSDTTNLVMSLINSGLPSKPTQAKAAAQNQQIQACLDYLETLQDALNERYRQNQRVVMGDAAGDSYRDEQERQEAARWRAITSGQDDYSKWNRERAEINAARDAENSRQRQQARQNRLTAQEQVLHSIGRFS